MVRYCRAPASERNKVGSVKGVPILSSCSDIDKIVDTGLDSKRPTRVRIPYAYLDWVRKSPSSLYVTYRPRK